MDGFSSIIKNTSRLLERGFTHTERVLIIGRLDNVVAGSAQLIKPAKNNEAQSHSCVLTFSLHHGLEVLDLLKQSFKKPN